MRKHFVALVVIALSLSAPALTKSEETASAPSPSTAVKSEVREDVTCSSCESDCAAPCCQCAGPLWTARADALFLNRSSTGGQSLVREPRAGNLLDSSDLATSTAVGPRLSLIRHGQCGWDVELNYFGIDGWESNAVVPNTAMPSHFGLLVVDEKMLLPVHDVDARYRSRLYSSELNLRRPVNCWLTPLVGFRWVELNEDYRAVGTEATLMHEFNETINAHNHLYGLQIGADARLFERGCRFRVDGLVRTGIFYNAADQNSELMVPGGIGTLDASADKSHTSFLGELGVVATYRLNDHVSLRGGYQLMWIEGVALAPRQIPVTSLGSGDAAVDSTGGVFYHGANAGLEFNW
jgi:hypothetical protein